MKKYVTKLLRRGFLKKLVAASTAVGFLFSFVFAPSVQAAMEARAGAERFRNLFDGMVLPASIGRVTDTRYCGSKKVVIDIQDLHCHAEVQRNIARILQLLDDKYKLKRVLVEGAAGQVDTSWLTNIKDEKQRKELVEALLADGRLTGSEYYSVLSKRPQVLQGLEDDAVYRENFVRLSKILEKKEEYGRIVFAMRNDLKAMQETYYNRSNRKFEEMLERYRQGKMDGKKYYVLLKKYAEKLNEQNKTHIADIDIESYRHMNAYLSLAEEGKELKYRNIARQLQEFVRILKQKLPYGAYNSLLEKTDNFTKLDELYVYLAKMAKEYRLNLQGSFPQLAEFFDYLEKGTKINPLAMVQEEQRLIAEIRTGLSQDRGEREVSFLTDFLGHFDDYLNNRLTADEYEYFEKHFEEFKMLWGKYAEENRLAALNNDFELLDAYYRTNGQRNQCFLKNMLGEYKNGAIIAPADDLPEVLTSLDTADEIIVVVAGGFHTEGIKKLLAERNVSYLAITPNVTQDTKTSDVVYLEMAKQQAKVLSQAFALRLLSQLGDEEEIKEIMEHELNITLQEGEDIKKLAKKIAEEKLEELFTQGKVREMVAEWNTKYGAQFGRISFQSNKDEELIFTLQSRDGTKTRTLRFAAAKDGKIRYKEPVAGDEPQDYEQSSKKNDRKGTALTAASSYAMGKWLFEETFGGWLLLEFLQLFDNDLTSKRATELIAPFNPLDLPLHIWGMLTGKEEVKEHQIPGIAGIALATAAAAAVFPLLHLSIPLWGGVYLAYSLSHFAYNYKFPGSPLTTGVPARHTGRKKQSEAQSIANSGMSDPAFRVVKDYDELEKILNNWELRNPDWLGPLKTIIEGGEEYNDGNSLRSLAIRLKPVRSMQDYLLPLDIDEEGQEVLGQVGHNEYVYVTLLQPFVDDDGRIEKYSFTAGVVRKTVINKLPFMLVAQNVNNDMVVRDFLFEWKLSLTVDERTGRVNILMDEAAINRRLEGQGMVASAFSRFAGILGRYFWGSEVTGYFASDKALHIFQKVFDNATLKEKRKVPGEKLEWHKNVETWSSIVQRERISTDNDTSAVGDQQADRETQDRERIKSPLIRSFAELDSVLNEWELNSTEWIKELAKVVAEEKNGGKSLPSINVRVNSIGDLRAGTYFPSMIDDRGRRVLAAMGDDEYVYLTLKEPVALDSIHRFRFRTWILKKSMLEKDFLTYSFSRVHSDKDNNILFLFDMYLTMDMEGSSYITLQEIAINHQLENRKLVSPAFHSLLAVLGRYFGGSRVAGPIVNKKSLHMFKKNVKDPVNILDANMVDAIGPWSATIPEPESEIQRAASRKMEASLLEAKGGNGTLTAKSSYAMGKWLFEETFGGWLLLEFLQLFDKDLTSKRATELIAPFNPLDLPLHIWGMLTGKEEVKEHQIPGIAGIALATAAAAAVFPLLHLSIPLWGGVYLAYSLSHLGYNWKYPDSPLTMGTNTSLDEKTERERLLHEAETIRKYIAGEKGEVLDAPVIIDWKDLEKALPDNKTFLKERIQNNNFVVIYPGDLVVHEKEEDTYRNLRKALEILSEAISENNQGIEVNPNEGEYFTEYHKTFNTGFGVSLETFSIREMLKNAFYHGNKADFTKPIYVYVDWKNHQIAVINGSNAGKRESRRTRQRMELARKAIFSGTGLGEYWITTANRSLIYHAFHSTGRMKKTPALVGKAEEIERERYMEIGRKLYTRMIISLNYAGAAPRIVRDEWPFRYVLRDGNLKIFRDGNEYRSYDDTEVVSQIIAQDERGKGIRENIENGNSGQQEEWKELQPISHMEHDVVRQRILSEGEAIKKYIAAESGAMLDAPVIIDREALEAALRGGASILKEKIKYNNFIAVDLSGYAHDESDQKFYSDLKKELKILAKTIAGNNQGIEVDPKQSRHYESLGITFNGFHGGMSVEAYSINEMLKNAFYHGNKTDFNKPIYVYVDWNNHKIAVINDRNAGRVNQETLKKMKLARNASMAGNEAGEHDIMRANNKLIFYPFAETAEMKKDPASAKQAEQIERERFIAIGGNLYTRMIISLTYDGEAPEIVRREWPYLYVRKDGKVMRYNKGVLDNAADENAKRLIKTIPHNDEGAAFRPVKDNDEIEKILNTWELHSPAWLGPLGKVIEEGEDYNNGRQLKAIDIHLGPQRSFKDYLRPFKIDMKSKEILKTVDQNEYVYVTITQPIVGDNDRIEGYSYTAAVVRKSAIERIPSMLIARKINNDVNDDKDFLLKWELVLARDDRSGRVNIVMDEIGINRHLEGKGLISVVFTLFKEILGRHFWGSEVTGKFASEKALHMFRKTFKDAVLVEKRQYPEQSLEWFKNYEIWSAVVSRNKTAAIVAIAARKGSKPQRTAAAIPGVNEIARIANPMNVIRTVLKSRSRPGEGYRQQEEVLKGKAIFWIDRNKTENDLRTTVNNASLLQAQQPTNNMIVTQLKGVTNWDATDHETPLMELPIKVTGKTDKPAKVSVKFITAANGSTVAVYYIHTTQEDFPAAAADLIDRLSSNGHDTELMRNEFENGGIFGDLNIERIGMGAAAVIADEELLGIMKQEAMQKGKRDLLDTAFISIERGYSRTGMAGLPVADARLGWITAKDAKDVLSTIGAAARMKKKETEARGKYIIGSLDVAEMVKKNLKSKQLLTDEQAKNLTELMTAMRETAGSGDIRLTGLIARLEEEDSKQKEELLAGLYHHIRQMNRDGLKIHGDYRMKGTDDVARRYVDRLLGTFDGLEIDLRTAKGWTKDSLAEWLNGVAQRHAGKMIAVDLPSEMTADAVRALKAMLKESVLVIAENETDSEGDQLLKLRLTGRRDELQKVKAAVIEVPLTDLAEYGNDNFDKEKDTEKLQWLKGKLEQIVPDKIKENMQRVQQLFAETPASVYDSVLLYEPEDIPGIEAWNGIKGLLSREEFATVQQYFGGDVLSLKGMDDQTAEDFAKAMKGFVTAGMIDKNTAAALKIQQLARQVTDAKDNAEKIRYAGMLAMLGKGLSEKVLAKHAGTETKTEEFLSAENNRLFGQLLLQKALRSDVTPETLAREMDSLEARVSREDFSDIQKMLKQVIDTGQLPSEEYDARRIGAYVDTVMERFGGDINAKKKNELLQFIETVIRFFLPGKAAQLQIEKDQYVKAATRVLAAMKEQGKQDSFDELLRILYLYADRKVKAVTKEERIEVQTIRAMLGAA